jgi:hypothetical protein
MKMSVIILYNNILFPLLITDRFSVGQNVAATWTFDKPSPTGEEPEFKRQIEAWFNEVTQIGFRPKDIDPFNFNRQAGHYSQVRPRRQATGKI